MRLRITFLLSLAVAACAQTVIVRPQEIADVLVNPGMGFMTFQRFNGDKLNDGKKWTEGYPIVYQEFKGSLKNENHPDTSIAYFRIYWKFIEPEPGRYNWELIDAALKTAKNRGQTLMLRVAPYGTEDDNDVPGWYREILGSEKGTMSLEKWRTNPEDPRYAQRFGGFIRALGARYDGNPDLESVDMALVGAWGEGAGSDLLSQKTREALVNSYLDAFPKTLLVMLLTDEKTNQYGLSRRDVGWRVDCLGDMGGFDNPNWSHMLDYYPQAIVKDGMAEAWKRAPVTLEVCWVMQHWLDKGWDVDYIIDQSLKWHISSFNAKSSAVPEQWRPAVDRWLKHMGYRLVLRKFEYRSPVRPGGKLEFSTWWENKGVAPCYRAYPVALRLSGPQGTEVIVTQADIRKWLPGDAIYEDSIALPPGLRAGSYDLAIGILDPDTRQPKLKLAIAGRTADGWYPLGRVELSESAPAPPAAKVRSIAER